MVTRLSGGLATWERRLDLAPYRLRVIGRASSGKPSWRWPNTPPPTGGCVANFHMLAGRPPLKGGRLLSVDLVPEGRLKRRMAA